MKKNNNNNNILYHLHVISHFLYKCKVPLLPFLIKQFIRFVFGAVIPPQAKIGSNVHFGYNGLGIVIHHRCVVGNNTWISQQVTLGGRGDEGVPVIGNNGYIGVLEQKF